MQEITLSAIIKNITCATSFVNAILDQHNCPMDVQIQIDIVIDELFGNIANYAYPDDVGLVTVQVSIEQNPTQAVITFIDSGTPYDPLQQDDPDISLSVAERRIGGLGIFVVKKTMDVLHYKYVDGKNTLTAKKRLFK